MNKLLLEAVLNGTAASESDCPGDCNAKIAVPPMAPVSPDSSAHPVASCAAVPVVWITRSSPGKIVPVTLVVVLPEARGTANAVPSSYQKLRTNCAGWVSVETSRNVVFQPSPLAICGMVLVAGVTPDSASMDVNALPLARMPRPKMGYRM